MADLSTLTSMQPGTVEAYGGILKTLIGLNPIVGGLITIIGAYFINKNTKVTKTNTEVTVTNTAAKSVTTDQLDTFKDSLNSIKAEASDEFKVILKEHAEASKQELEKLKIGLMRMMKQADAKLSMNPSITDAIERIKRLEKVNAEIIHELQGDRKK